MRRRSEKRPDEMTEKADMPKKKTLFVSPSSLWVINIFILFKKNREIKWNRF